MMFSQIIDTTSSSLCSSLLPLNIPSNSSIDSLDNVEIPKYPKKAGKWTIEEDDLLRKYVELFGEKQWRKISQHIPGRSSIQCLHRWSKILRPGLVKGPWTPEEDQKLVAWVESEGPNKWAQAANYIVGRSGKQCRERWFNNLNPDVKKGEWTKEEDELIFGLYKKHGSSWSRIAKLVPGRTENSIKNRFYSTLRRLTADRKKSSTTNTVKQNTSESTDTPSNEMEEEKTVDASAAAGQTHTLYKLLQESTLLEEEKDNQNEDDSDNHLIKILANRKSSNVSSKSYSSQETKSDNSGMLPTKTVFQRLLSENSCKIESPEHNEADQLKLQNLVIKIGNKIPSDGIPKLDNAFNLNTPTIQQRLAAQYYQPSVKSLAETLTHPSFHYNHPAHQNVQIPRLGAFPTTRPQPAMHRPMINSFPIQEEAMMPKLPPLKIPSGFSQRNLQPINFNTIPQAPNRASLFGANRLPSNPMIPALNDLRAAEKQVLKEKADSYNYLRNCLKGTKQSSQCSDVTQSSLSEAQESFNINSFQLKASTMQQNSLSNLIQALRNTPTQPEQKGAHVSGLLDQIHSLEELFTNVKGQLIRLESSLNTTKQNDIRMKIEDLNQKKAKRSLESVLQHSLNLRVESEDALMKKIKVE